MLTAHTAWLGFSVLAFLAGLSPAAVADGLPQRAHAGPAAPAEPIANRWSGFYAGLNAGAARTDADVTNGFCAPGNDCFFYTGVPARLTAVTNGRASDTGFTAGAQLGYNWQWDTLVLGVEADLNSMRTNATRNASAVYSPTDIVGSTLTDQITTSYLATLRGRVGYAMGNLLAYFTGGLAVSNVRHTPHFGEFNYRPGPPCVPTNDNFCDIGGSTLTRTGWVIGSGAEWAFDSKWSLKAEYLYADFGKTTSKSNIVDSSGAIQFGGVIDHSAEISVQTVRVGLNYRF